MFDITSGARSWFVTISGQLTFTCRNSQLFGQVCGLPARRSFDWAEFTCESALYTRTTGTISEWKREAPTADPCKVRGNGPVRVMYATWTSHGPASRPDRPIRERLMDIIRCTGGGVSLIHLLRKLCPKSVLNIVTKPKTSVQPKDSHCNWERWPNSCS